MREVLARGSVGWELGMKRRKAIVKKTKLDLKAERDELLAFVKKFIAADGASQKWGRTGSLLDEAAALSNRIDEGDGTVLKNSCKVNFCRSTLTAREVIEVVFRDIQEQIDGEKSEVIKRCFAVLRDFIVRDLHTNGGDVG